MCEHMLSLNWFPSSTAQRTGGLMFTEGNSQGVDLGMGNDPRFPGVPGPVRPENHQRLGYRGK